MSPLSLNSYTDKRCMDFEEEWTHQKIKLTQAKHLIEWNSYLFCVFEVSFCFSFSNQMFNLIVLSESTIRNVKVFFVTLIEWFSHIYPPFFPSTLVSSCNIFPSHLMTKNIHRSPAQLFICDRIRNVFLLLNLHVRCRNGVVIIIGPSGLIF